MLEEDGRALPPDQLRAAFPDLATFVDAGVTEARRLALDQLSSLRAKAREELVAERDLYEKVRERLSERERQIAELWAAGHSFPEISERLRQTGGEPAQPNALRMTLQRAFLRVAREMPQG